MLPFGKSTSFSISQWLPENLSSRCRWEALDLPSEYLLCVPDPEPTTHMSTSEKKKGCPEHASNMCHRIMALPTYYINKENLPNLSTDRLEVGNPSKIPPFLNERHRQLWCNFSSYLKRASREGMRSRQPPKAGGVSGKQVQSGQGNQKADGTVASLLVPSCNFPGTFSMSQVSTGNQILLLLIIEGTLWNAFTIFIKRGALDQHWHMNTQVELEGDKKNLGGRRCKIQVLVMQSQLQNSSYTPKT